MKQPLALYILLALLLIQGLGALTGGMMLMIRPDGALLGMPVSVLENSIFPNFFILGFVLFLVLGAFPVATFGVMIARPSWAFFSRWNIYSHLYFGWTWSLLTGLGLIIWMDVEVMVVGYGSLLQTAYSFLGLLIIIFTLSPSAMRYYKLSETI